MNHVESFNESSPSKEYFDDIDRIINAQRIERFDDLRRLTRSIDQLIQSIIININDIQPCSSIRYNDIV